MKEGVAHAIALGIEQRPVPGPLQPGAEADEETDRGGGLPACDLTATTTTTTTNDNNNNNIDNDNNDNDDTHKNTIIS